MPGSSTSERRRLVGCIAVLLLVAGCGAPPPPSATSTFDPAVGPQASSSPRVSSKPFVATSYPKAGDAPCGETVAPDANHGAYTGNLKRIVATDAHTVEFDLCEPDAAFLAKIASPAFAIQDSAWLQAKIDPGSSGEQAIVREVNGSGPYRLDTWERGSDIIMARADGYWGSPAASDRLIVRWADAASGRLAQLQDGTVDGMDDVGTTDAAAVAGDPDLQPLEREGMNTMYIGFTDSFAPFDDENVRGAIARAIDRAAIVEAAFPTGSTVASHVSPCAITDGCTGKDWPAYDPALAKSMLAAAGYPNGFATTIRYSDTPRDYLPDPTQTAALIRDQLKTNLGIDAKLEVMPLDQLVTQAEAGKLDGIHLLGARPRYPDISAVLDPLLGSASSSEFGAKHDDITAALSAGGATADPAKRTAAYTKANDAISRHVPLIPVAHVGSMVAYRADVTSAEASPARTERFATMVPGDRRQLVWMQAAEPKGLYCADETDPATLRICAQMSESLYAFTPGSAAVVPALAKGCVADAGLVTWTCTLRPDVRFQDGATLDASDVVDTFAVQWDAANPRHKGRDGTFATFETMFGGFLDPPP